MRTLYPVVVILAIGVAGVMWSMSGIGLIYGQEDPVDTGESSDKLNETAESPEQDSDDGGLFGIGNVGEESFVGIAISAAGSIVDFVTAAVLLPLELQRLGLPRWFALPLGLGAQSIAFVGFLQFIAGRDYR